jgi:amino acid adenylation domain-containing protein
MVSELVHRPSHETLYSVLADASAECPHKTAIDAGGTQLSWAELEGLSRQASRLLARVDIVAVDRIVLLAPASPRLLAVLYGIFRIGAVAVPLDIKNPPRRIASVLADATPALLVTTGAIWRSVFTDALRGEILCRKILLIDEDGGADFCLTWRDIGVESTDAPPPACVGSDLAYILYTSGSTGKPKGVMLSHRNVLAFAHWAQREFDIGSADRVAWVTPLSFDLSTFDLFASGIGRATILIPSPGITLFPSRYPHWLAESQASVLYTVPSALSALLMQEQAAFERLGLRLVLFAGEVFPPAKLVQLRRALPEAVLANLFGPTETNVCTFYRVTDHTDLAEPLPIGRPASGARLSIGGAPVEHADEIEGELIVTGPSVALGYWNDPELTASRFSGNGDVGVFATGDIVSLRADGELAFHGRRDDNVKILGHRVALGEIEHAVGSIPEIDAAAVCFDAGKLSCFIVAKDPQAAIGQARAACRRHLLPHMIPSEFISLMSMPLTATGKIDRTALRQWTAQ